MTKEEYEKASKIMDNIKNTEQSIKALDREFESIGAYRNDEFHERLSVIEKEFNRASCKLHQEHLKGLHEQLANL